MNDAYETPRKIASQRIAPLFSSINVTYPKGLMITQLILYAVLASFSNLPQLLPVAASVAAAAAFDSIHNRLRYDNDKIPGGAIITALIVSGIVLPGDYAAVWVTILALFLKHVLTASRRNVFNPAALGLYIASFFGVGLAWWASGSLIVLVMGLIVAYLTRSEVLALSFLISYWLLSMAMNPVLLSSPAALLMGHAVFFALIMVVEPLTSPNTRHGQAFYGVGVALIALTLSYAAQMIPAIGVISTDNFLLSLLIMNLLQRIGPDRWLA